MAEIPETSDFTSVQQRIFSLDSSVHKALTGPPKLMPLVKSNRDHHVNSIGYELNEYLELVDWAGRQIREDKRGAIAEDAPPILQRLGLDDTGFLEFVGGENKAVKPRVIGTVESIKQAASQLGQNFLNGLSQARSLYLSSA